MDEPFNDRDFKSEVEAFRVENDNLKRDQEKITIDYELKIEHLKKDINLKSVSYENLMLNFQELDTKYKNCCQEKIDINQNYFDLSQEKFNIIKKFDNLESEHATILELIARREKELLNSKNEIHELKTQLIAYKNNEIEIKLSRNDLEYRQKDFEKMESISIMRNKKLRDDIKLLEDKLIEAKKENFDEKSKHNKIVYEMNLDLDSKKNEIKNMKMVNDKLKEKNSYLEKVNEEKTESLRSAVESQSSIDNLLRKELNVQISINELYKEERDEFLEKNNSLISIISDLQNSLKDTYDENDKIKSECDFKLNELSLHISTLRREINEKDKELNNANDLLEKFRVNSLSEEELKSLNPATASAISALKRGFSLTQIYSEYVQLTNERDELRVDRDRLNEYMMAILDELEQKAPILKRTQTEHANLELSLYNLSKKYDDNLSQLLIYESEMNENRLRCEDLTKKLKIEKQTNEDLGMQVCSLIREIETYRGTIIRSDDRHPIQEEPALITRMRNFKQRGLINQSHSSVSSNSIDDSRGFVTAKDVISTHLVTFRNICELQQQNIALIQQFRELSDHQESTESLINENSLQELAKKLSKADQEIDEMRTKLKLNKNMRKTIESQQLIIHALKLTQRKPVLAISLENADLSTLDSTDKITKSVVSLCDDDKIDKQQHNNTISVLNARLVSNQEHLDKLNSELTKLRNEKNLQIEKHARTVEELHQQLADAKIVNANLISKLSYNQEKTTSLEQNLINRQMELSESNVDLGSIREELIQKKEENRSLNAQLIRYEGRQNEMETELRRMQADMKHVENLEEQIANEKKEKYQLITNTGSIVSQISSLQTLLIKPQPEQEMEEKIELKSRIKQLNLELKQEKSKYQNSLEVWQSKFSESSSQIDSLTSQLSSAIRANSSDNNLVISDSCTIGILQTTTEKREKTSDLESQLEDLTVSNYSLKKQLESYHEIMSNSENKLISNAQLIEEMELRFQDKIDEERRKNSDIEELLENIQMAYGQIETERNSLKKSLLDQIEDLNTLLIDKDKKILLLNEELGTLKENEVQFKADLERQRKLTKDATDNYQQELIFHAQESDKLQELDEKMNKCKKHEMDLSVKLQEVSLLKDQYKSDLDRLEHSRKEEKEALEKELSDLRIQKDVLSTRLIVLNESVIDLKKMLDPSIDCGIDIAIIQRESDWNEVIQYLRQEKESAEKTKNQLEIELQKLKSLYSEQEDKIQELHSALEEERKFKVLEMETTKQHAEVMRKLELGQMLSESNVMLRQDREKLKEELSEKTKKLEKLQELIEPLKSELKTKTSEIESVKLDSRSLENERDLWRRRCDTLIEKSKQVNPEDFKQICLEKDNMQHELLVLEDKCRLNLSRVNELQLQIENYIKLVSEQEEQLESAKKLNDENIQIMQRRESLIIQLKEIGRKYRAETESQKIEIDLKEEKIREFQSTKKELEECRRHLQQFLNQTSSSSVVSCTGSDELAKRISATLHCPNSAIDIIETVDKLVKDNLSNVQLLEKGDSEQKLRNQAIEGHLSKLKSDNERLKKQLENNRQVLNLPDDENVLIDDSSTEVVHPTSTWHIVPTVARVAANVHPVVQKPQNIMSGTNQISPNSQTVSNCQSTARQTAEIRPIPAVSLHIPASTTSTVVTDVLADNASNASVTTSLPANVVQALAASSVVFPAVTAFSTTPSATSIISNYNRLKRCFEECTNDSSDSRTVMNPSTSSDQSNAVKKIRVRITGSTDSLSVSETPETIVSHTQAQHTNLQSFVSNIERFEMDDLCEEEVEIECEDIETSEVIINEINNGDNEKSIDNSMLIGRIANSSENECSVDEDNNYNNDFEDDDDNLNEDEDDEDDDDEDDEDDDDVNLDDDDDDEEPDVIDLLSSDDDNIKSNNDDVGDIRETSGMKEDKISTTFDDSKLQSTSCELDDRKKRIEPIVWGDNSRKNSLMSTNRPFPYLVSPPKVGQPIKPTRINSSNMAFRRKIAPRRNYQFGSARGVSSLAGRGGVSVSARRSVTPYKAGFIRR